MTLNLWPHRSTPQAPFPVLSSKPSPPANPCTCLFFHRIVLLVTSLLLPDIFTHGEKFALGLRSVPTVVHSRSLANVLECALSSSFPTSGPHWWSAALGTAASVLWTSLLWGMTFHEADSLVALPSGTHLALQIKPSYLDALSKS